MVKLPESLTTVTRFSKTLALVLFIFLPFLGFYLGVNLPKQSSPPSPVIHTKTTTISPSSIPPPPCANLTLANYDRQAEYTPGLISNVPKPPYEPELVRIYTQPTSFYSEHVPPLVVRLFTFSQKNHCYTESFSSSFPANELQESKLLPNFWKNNQDVVMFIPQSTGYGSGFSSQMQFLAHRDNKYQVIPGPELDELSSYKFINGHDILVGRANWVMLPAENAEGHFDPHTYSFEKYTWNGFSYVKTKLGTTKNKYAASINEIIKAEPAVLTNQSF